MAVSGSTILHDSVLKVRALIASGVSDPISANRWTASGCRFVVTSFPERLVQYPVITVAGNKGRDERMGTQTQAMKTPVFVEVDVYSKSTKERDTLADAVYQTLKTSQMGIQAGWTGTELDLLYDFHFLNEFNIDEVGKRGIHRKHQSYSYFMIG